MASDGGRQITSGSPPLERRSDNSIEINSSGMEINMGFDAGGRAGKGGTGGDSFGSESQTHEAIGELNENENDTVTIPPKLFSPFGRLDSEDLHILLIHLSFLALSRHSSRPVVELNMKKQVLQLDAFLSDNVTDDGDATHWLPESETEARLHHYKDVCAHLVPKITAAIKKQSHDNLTTEHEGRGDDGNNSEQKIFCEMFLAPKVVDIYGEWIEKERNKNEDFNPEFDPWVEPVKNKKLIALLNTIVEIQHDFTVFQHISPKPIFNQLQHPEGIQFQRVMSDFESIRTEYRIKTSSGKVFSQTTMIPETHLVYTENEARKMWRNKHRSKYFVPDPVDVTVPKKDKKAIWHNADRVGKKWTRGDTIFEPSLIFFVMDVETDAYIHHHIVAPALLDKIDLNNESWVSSYRKKVSQWRKRGTGQTTKIRDHWSDDEKAAIYEWANAFCRKNGIDLLTPRRIDTDKGYVLNALNTAVPGNRSMDSVSAWTRTQMTKKPNLPLGLLAAEQQRIAALINNNQPVPNIERYPVQFIDISNFLAQSKKKTAAKKIEKNHKRNEDQAEEEYMMKNPANFDVDGDSDNDGTREVVVGGCEELDLDDLE